MSGERREKREENAAELPSMWKGVWAWNMKGIKACPYNLGSPELIAEACTWNTDVYPALYHQTEIYQKSALGLIMIYYWQINGKTLFFKRETLQKRTRAFCSRNVSFISSWMLSFYQIFRKPEFKHNLSLRLKCVQEPHLQTGIKRVA